MAGGAETPHIAATTAIARQRRAKMIFLPLSPLAKRAISA
jgi:hypothetical protein